MFMKDYTDNIIEKLKEITVSDVEETEDEPLHPIYKFCVDPKEAHVRIRNAASLLNSNVKRVNELQAELREIELSQKEDAEPDEMDIRVRNLELRVHEQERETMFLRGQLAIYERLFDALRQDDLKRVSDYCSVTSR